MLRALFKSDLQRLLAIEQAAHATPWTAETFKTCFEAGHTGWVVEDPQKVVVGFIMVAIRADECHILNICVAREFQHQGLGRRLMQAALDQSKKRGVTIVYLEVRKTNEYAIALYQKMNFKLIAERKGYYPTVAGNEDALVYALTMGSGMTC